MTDRIQRSPAVPRAYGKRAARPYPAEGGRRP